MNASSNTYNQYQILSSNVCEIVEPEVHINNHLSLRAYEIPKYDCKSISSLFPSSLTLLASDLGPPDCCYLVKELKGGLLTAKVKAGFFHYVYGVDASSTASVAAYIREFINQH